MLCLGGLGGLGWRRMGGMVTHGRCSRVVVIQLLSPYHSSHADEPRYLNEGCRCGWKRPPATLFSTVRIRTWDQDADHLAFLVARQAPEDCGRNPWSSAAHNTTQLELKHALRDCGGARVTGPSPAARLSRNVDCSARTVSATSGPCRLPVPGFIRRRTAVRQYGGLYESARHTAPLRSVWRFTADDSSAAIREEPPGC